MHYVSIFYLAGILSQLQPMLFYSGLLNSFSKLYMVQFIFAVVSVKFHYLKVVL